MAEYKSFEDNILVGGHELPVFAWGKLGAQQYKELLDRHGLDGSHGAWNDLQSFLNAMKDLADTIGEMNLFLIGKAIIDGARFPPMDSLENALNSIDIAYHMNHKKNGRLMYNPETGEMMEGIGHYQLTRYNEALREAIMICHTPYPTKLEEGLISQVLKRFKPPGSLFAKVRLDSTKEAKNMGGESCTFIMNW